MSFVNGIYLTFKYNDAITCICLPYPLRSHVNQTPKMNKTIGSKLGLHLEISEKNNYCIRG